MRKEDDGESVSGALRGSGEGAGSADLPYPRTDAEDTGRGDGGMERGSGERADAARGADRPDDAAHEAAERAGGRPDSGTAGGDTGSRGRDAERGDWGDEGIAGGRAGGTGL